jgi:hypothetical protein
LRRYRASSPFSPTFFVIQPVMFPVVYSVLFTALPHTFSA